MKDLLRRVTSKFGGAKPSEDKLKPLIDTAQDHGIRVLDRSEGTAGAIPYLDLDIPKGVALAAADRLQIAGWKFVHPHKIAMFAVMSRQPDPFPNVNDQRVKVYAKGVNPQGGKIPEESAMKNVRKEIAAASAIGPVRLVRLGGIGQIEDGVAAIKMVAQLMQEATAAA